MLIPAGTPERAYRLFMIADAAGQVGESNETNNSAVSAEFFVTNSPGSQNPLADLTVTALTVPATLVSGNDLPISWTVRNVNFATTDSSIWYDDVWLSRDNVIDAVTFKSVAIYTTRPCPATSSMCARSLIQWVLI